MYKKNSRQQMFVSVFQFALQFLPCRHTVSCRLSHFTSNELANIQLFRGAVKSRIGRSGRQGHGGHLDVFEWQVHEVFFSETRGNGLNWHVPGGNRMANLVS